ncbi:uncharacterized protein LOC132488699 isoform X1 [Mesoplodon densirostris]|uniref:uncharacterized protein LOC132488699 isoform X1 n=1 Tax=Mesoplodon densirostris TaxID=48708 RepID=UPI0028DD3561|nr:uncharacterized protein LOC132488699 isoform X1 [Mesoplodon densirostris]
MACQTCASVSPQGGLRPRIPTHQMRGHQPDRSTLPICPAANASNICSLSLTPFQVGSRPIQQLEKWQTQSPPSCFSTSSPDLVCRYPFSRITDPPLSLRWFNRYPRLSRSPGNSTSPTTPNHPPGDSVLLKELHPQSLKPRWTGPHTVILTTPMAAKLLGHPSWYHVSRLKMAPTPETWTALPLGPTRLRLVRHPVSPPAPPPATQDSPDFPMALPCPRDMAS